MRLTNVAGCPAGWTMGFERDGREMLVVAVKATYHIEEGSDEPVPALEPVPLVEADRFTGEPGLSAPLLETDYAHRKLACDIVVVGCAHAIGGRPATHVPVGLRFGAISKRFMVVGERRWQKKVSGYAPGEPLPFTTMPITYDNAFGGSYRVSEDDEEIITYRTNPVGKGFSRTGGDVDEMQLPNTEDINRPVSSPSGDFAPMAFSPIGRNWLPRSSYAGTYDEAWMENQAPFWPDDFDHRYFQCAAADQIVPYPVGGEDVVLVNMTPSGRLAFRLPVRPMPVTFIPHKGNDVTLSANVDTIVIEPEERRFSMTWRANLRLGRSIFDVKEAVVGQMSPAWYRARRFPGKAYYRNLEELVRERGRQR